MRKPTTAWVRLLNPKDVFPKIPLPISPISTFIDLTDARENGWLLLCLDCRGEKTLDPLVIVGESQIDVARLFPRVCKVSNVCVFFLIGEMYFSEILGSCKVDPISFPACCLAFAFMLTSNFAPWLDLIPAKDLLLFSAGLKGDTMSSASPGLALRNVRDFRFRLFRCF